MDATLPLRIARTARVATDIKSLDLVHVDSVPLPPFEAGAHIELQLPNRVGRSYSLLNAPGECSSYRIAVHRSPESAGGSRYIHESLHEGDVILASPPRNNFPLDESAPHSCLIAGGIGITPILSMAHRLSQLGRTWELHYGVRTHAHAAFADELKAMADTHGQSVSFYFDKEPEGRAVDLKALALAAGAATHLYCCGPRGMLEAFEAATSHCRSRAHVEYFVAKAEAAREGGYTIELKRSGLVLDVPPGRTILDVVFEAGVTVGSSCREGICGTCETRIISGEADHRDSVLSAEEQAANETMMICCSGAKSKLLVLDL